MDRKRHFPALGHVGGNSATISVSGWKMAGKAQHVIHKGVPLGRVEEGTRALWFRGSPTVGDHYCHSSTAEGRHLLSAQQNSSTEENISRSCNWELEMLETGLCSFPMWSFTSLCLLNCFSQTVHWKLYL